MLVGRRRRRDPRIEYSREGEDDSEGLGEEGLDVGAVFGEWQLELGIAG